MTTEVTREVHHDVAAVQIRYATAVDRRDWALFRTCFTDDCEVDYGVIGAWRGVDELTEWMRATHEPCGHTLHRITNHVVTPASSGTGRVDAGAYVDALVMFAGDRSGTRAAGFYDDELVNVDGAWQIERRRFTLVAVQFIAERDLMRIDAPSS